MAAGKTKTTINIDSEVYQAAKKHAANLGVDFGELVELSLSRDQSEKMAILRTDDGIVYAPIESPSDSGDAIDELIKYLGDFEKRCREQRWLGALFHVGVVQKIAEDVKEFREVLAARLAAAEKNPQSVELKDKKALQVLDQETGKPKRAIPRRQKHGA